MDFTWFLIIFRGPGFDEVLNVLRNQDPMTTKYISKIHDMEIHLKASHIHNIALLKDI